MTWLGADTVVGVAAGLAAVRIDLRAQRNRR